MEKPQATMSYKLIDDEIKYQALRTQVVFKRVFNTPDGKYVIRMLHKSLRFSPKTDIECAKLVGMNAVINMILEFSGFFDEDTEYGRDSGDK